MMVWHEGETGKISKEKPTRCPVCNKKLFQYRSLLICPKCKEGKYDEIYYGEPAYSGLSEKEKRNAITKEKDMKFMITSMSGKLPEETYEDKYVCEDKRIGIINPADTFISNIGTRKQKIMYGKPQPPLESWNKHGKNHRTEEVGNDVYFIRDIEQKGNFIDINTIKELLEFIRKTENQHHGKGIIIEVDNPHKDEYQGEVITIYDDYIE